MNRDISATPHIYTVCAGESLLAVLADHLLYENTFAYGQKQQSVLDYSDLTLLLPTKRAVRAMGEMFLARSEGKACILPQMRALGDVEEAELGLNEFLHFTPEELASTPTIAPLERQLRLSRHILKIYPEVFSPERSNPDINPSSCLRIARELLKLIDSAQIEEKNLSDLASLVTDQFAENWQQTIEFLKLITDLYPAEIEKAHLMEPMIKRNQLMRLYGQELERAGKSKRIIAAGSTASTPATADLLDTISKLPQGAVILPGLDLHMDEETWEDLDEEHPQYGMQNLMKKLGMKRDEVVLLSSPGSRSNGSVREKLMSEVMRPAEKTDKWTQTLNAFEADQLKSALRSVKIISANSPREEALIIALHLRESLETPGKTAALVTPDRALAKRVASEMKRWGVEIYDSAGEKLCQCARARAVLLIAGVLREDFSPVSLLSLLRHPDVYMGLSKTDLNHKTDHLERLILRGPRPASGLDGLKLALNGQKGKAGADESARLLKSLEEIFAPFLDFDVQKTHRIEDLIGALIQIFENLLRDDSEQASGHIWAGEEGEALANLFHDLLSAAEYCPALKIKDLKEYLLTLMDDRVIREKKAAHPRLHILGLLEARLLSFDLVILGSMNETTWPQIAAIDPWLNRPMRAQLELPSPERRIGLSAHDFVQNFCASEVVVTRSEKIDGVPTVPSRWLLRLRAVMDSLNCHDLISNGHDWAFWASQLDRPDEVVPALPPRPTPPVGARPRKLSVTQIETWQRDPYAIYARHILKLKPLDDLDADPGFAEKGTLIHKIMERFNLETSKRGGSVSLAVLQNVAKEEFEKWQDRPSVTAFWLPRFERIAAWYVPQEENLRASLKCQYVEVDGEVVLQTDGDDFTLSARADRIDLLEDGSLRILDYKTGILPGKKEVGAFSSQLPLEAFMARLGCFKGVQPAPVSYLGYIKLSGAEPPGEIREAYQKKKGESERDIIERLIDKSVTGLKARISRFDIFETPYLCRISPKNEEVELDYDHLSRYREWAVLQKWEDRSK